MYREAWAYYQIVANQVITAGMDGVVLGINQTAVHSLLQMLGLTFGGVRYVDIFFKILSIDNTLCGIRYRRRESELKAKNAKNNKPSSKKQPSMIIKRL